jgi:hypothetical protein
VDLLAGGKQSSWLERILDYIGNRRKMEKWNSVPVGMPVGQNETTWLSHDLEANQ